MARNFVHALIAALFLLCTTTEAYASLIGTTFDAKYFYPDLTTPYAPAVASPSTFTVIDPGIETGINVEGVTTILTDFTGDSLRFQFNTSLSSPKWNTADFSGVVFNRISGAPLSLLSASIDPSSTLSGFDLSRVTFDDNQLAINWNGLSYIDGTALLIQFTSDPHAVPEPSMWALFAVAIGALAWVRNRAGRI